MKNVLLTISYNGTEFQGWQIQENCRTVQGELQKVLSEVCDQEMKVNGTSRTDSGVHALGQRATFSGDFGIPVHKLKMVVNRLLPNDIKIEAVEEVPMDFHARFQAVGKQYVYKIRHGEERNVFFQNFYCHIDSLLNTSAMMEGATSFVGTHDFKGFMARGSNLQGTTVRTIFSFKVQEISENEVFLIIKGNGFLYNMVRIMAGTLIDVGQGKVHPSNIGAIIESRERKCAGKTAPPQGLYLAKVYYDVSELQKNDE